MQAAQLLHTGCSVFTIGADSSIKEAKINQ